MKRGKPSYRELQSENEQLRRLLYGKMAEAKSCDNNHLNLINRVQPAMDSGNVQKIGNPKNRSSLSGTAFAENEGMEGDGRTSLENSLQAVPLLDISDENVPFDDTENPVHWNIPLHEYRFLLNEALKIPGILPGNIHETKSETEDFSSSLLNVLPSGINIVDEQGNILFQSENLTGSNSGDVVNRKCWSVLCDSKTQCTTCQLTEGIQVGKTTDYEYSGMAGGKVYHISQTGILYKGEKALLEVFQDVTGKKEIKKKVKLLAQALESIRECVSITDQDDRIIYVNESFRRTYGYAKDELIGRNIQMVRPEEMKQQKIRDILTKTIEGGWRGEIMNQKKDGTLFPVFLSSSAIKDDQGKLTALIGVAMDISEIRQTRVELQQAKELAEESNRLKTALLNNLSHEIRTPMNAIVGFSNLMPDATTEEKIAYSGIIKKSAGHLLSMLDDVILISRLQSERMPLNPTDCQPADLIGHVHRMFQHSDLNKGLAIRMNVPETQQKLQIRADEDKIVQVLTNLVSNAVKYALKGTVEIGFNVLSGFVEFYVEDTGIGIPRNELNEVFDNFYRGEQALKYAIRGDGLGLCITRELVKLMGGEIAVTSEVNKGSRFYFTVPTGNPAC